MINDCGIKIIYQLNKIEIIHFSIAYFSFLSFYIPIITKEGTTFKNFLKVLKSWKYEYIISSIPIINNKYHCLAVINLKNTKHIVKIIKDFKKYFLVSDPTWGYLLVDKIWFLNNCNIFLLIKSPKSNNYIFFTHQSLKKRTFFK